MKLNEKQGQVTQGHAAELGLTAASKLRCSLSVTSSVEDAAAQSLNGGTKSSVHVQGGIPSIDSTEDLSVNVAAKSGHCELAGEDLTYVEYAG
jgi:hypothetical protein